MDTLQNMRAFVRIVQCGSFTAAADSLDSSAASMSRAVSELEEHLRARLLNRSTRRLALTPTGERYMANCLHILSEVDSAEEEASCAHEHPAGLLRMHSFASIGQHYVLPAISRYRHMNPEVKVELTLSQSMPDLFNGSSDVSLITATSLSNSDLISHRLGSTFSVLCASPGYVHLHGAPDTPEDLQKHSCLILKTPTAPKNDWLLEGPERSLEMHVDGPVQVNMAESLAVAICEGLGIGMLPVQAAISGLRDGTLVRILPSYVLQKNNIYALYPSRRYLDAKTKTWVEFLRVQLPKMIQHDMEQLNQLTLRQGGGDSNKGFDPQLICSESERLTQDQ